MMWCEEHYHFPSFHEEHRAASASFHQSLSRAILWPPSRTREWSSVLNLGSSPRCYYAASLLRLPRKVKVEGMAYTVGLVPVQDMSNLIHLH